MYFVTRVCYGNVFGIAKCEFVLFFLHIAIGEVEFGLVVLACQVNTA